MQVLVMCAFSTFSVRIFSFRLHKTVPMANDVEKEMLSLNGS